MIQIINLPKILDQRGNLSFVEELKHIPFEIEAIGFTMCQEVQNAEVMLIGKMMNL